ncbi:hypothetical protein I4J20_11130 [Corynebacterium belfantii]|nr:hypothetical protein [Corynebacterium belfantii]
MGRVGACGDNAAMESFFSLVQKNVLDRGFGTGAVNYLPRSLTGLNGHITGKDGNEHWVN